MNYISMLISKDVQELKTEVQAARRIKMLHYRSKVGFITLNTSIYKNHPVAIAGYFQKLLSAFLRSFLDVHIWICTCFI